MYLIKVVVEFVRVRVRARAKSALIRDSDETRTHRVVNVEIIQRNETLRNSGI